MQTTIEDLMLIPWRDMHCGQLAYRVLTEVFGIDVRESDLWLYDRDSDPEEMEGLVNRYLETQGDRWEKIHLHDARPGDVVLSRGTEEFGRNHLSVVLRSTLFIEVITTTRRAGAPFRQRVERIPNLVGVYRFAGDKR